ncbi:uncharacterized protein LOC125591279 [Brassica napus]|uniref:uncharacterized protein LOC125591279 n=1 Tax=Brassica napus TaxID=3708 RepID=UPI002078671F|nr:uncharacterized protein LOC125591279 [Brassica napus]
MADKLHVAIRSMSLEDDDPIILPDEPKFHLFDENALSIIGRLLNPDAQNMARMIDFMPQAWRLYDRVRGIALSRDRFQFVFKREEDLITVLKDRPWSYNHWTMILERWTPSPPRDFLSKFEVWIRIRNIPINHYTIDTMYMLAKKVGAVIEIAYDPKRSQKTEYIRAKVMFSATDPAFEVKNLNLPSGDVVVIEYEYEKIHKRCYGCRRLTHEKSACPYSKQRLQRHVQKPLEKNIQEQTDIVPTTNRLEGPPGFPPLFPELPPEDRAMAMQYISHSNETERRARILRVQQSIELEKSNPPAVLTKISHNLEKEKGHVFGYGVSESASGETRMVAHAVTAPAGERIHSSSEVQLSGESISPAPAPKRPAVFTIGASGSSQTGSSRGRRNGRNRPPAWVRHIRPAKNVQSKSTPVHEQSDEGAPSSKRKAEGVQIEKGNKTSKTKEDTVASILRPLPSQ